jgi:hypothetical protein
LIDELALGMAGDINDIFIGGGIEEPLIDVLGR